MNHIRHVSDVADPLRLILHLDLDAFYTSVEMVENTDLQGKPVIVGGNPSGRGVVASASYPARAHGIHSAMPTARAMALCPNAVVLPVRHSLYQSYSKRVMEILRQVSPIFEQMSIDEAYLDVTDIVTHWHAGKELAQQLQRQIRQEVGLGCSLGVASNKLVAKVASDRDKPGGITVVSPGQEAVFLAPLPVQVLQGIGPKTARRLAQMNVRLVRDLAGVPVAKLAKRFGKQGIAMSRQAHGIDTRPVITKRIRKSVSQERTFTRDLAKEGEIDEKLDQLCQGVARHLARLELRAATIAIKIRYADFTTLTRQMTLSEPVHQGKHILSAAHSLFYRAWQVGRPIRLLGVTASHLSAPAGQLSLW